MKLSLMLFLAIMTTAKAATIAVIDSGVDYRHPQLAHKMWLNPNIEYKGDFPRVINGWNFVDNNAQIFNFSILKTYPSDIQRYFSIEANYNAGVLTEDDKKFLSEKLVDSDYMSKVSSYGSFAHGTHVAGIAVKGENHEVIGMTYLASSVASVLKNLKSMKASYTDEEMKLYAYLSYIAKDQATNFGKLTHFLSSHSADVANGSFGAPFKQVQTIGDIIFKEVYKKEPTDDESFKTAYILQYYVIKSYEEELSKTKNTLYVFAAGNDGLNNDIYPFSPSSVNVENSISVAATNGTTAIANFSNYGIKSVDVAAPGVNIYSSAPGVNNLPMSGTSQAAPYVSKIAGKLKDINPSLKPVQIKQILMGTVDKKSFLKKLVKSGGIVNEARATRAAVLSLKLNLNRAIFDANTQIVQSPKSIHMDGFSEQNLRHVELPSIFVE